MLLLYFYSILRHMILMKDCARYTFWDPSVDANKPFFFDGVFFTQQVGTEVFSVGAHSPMGKPREISQETWVRVSLMTPQFSLGFRCCNTSRSLSVTTPHAYCARGWSIWLLLRLKQTILTYEKGIGRRRIVPFVSPPTKTLRSPSRS